jgi:hypothetical protein
MSFKSSPVEEYPLRLINFVCYAWINSSEFQNIFLRVSRNPERCFCFFAWFLRDSHVKQKKIAFLKKVFQQLVKNPISFHRFCHFLIKNFPITHSMIFAPFPKIWNQAADQSVEYAQKKLINIAVTLHYTEFCTKKSIIIGLVKTCFCLIEKGKKAYHKFDKTTNLLSSQLTWVRVTYIPIFSLVCRTFYK